TAREMAGDVDASCALLRRLVPAPARVLEYGCGIGAAGLRLLDDGYQVHVANGSGPNTRYLRWRLARRGLDAPISDPQRDPLPQVDVAICGDVMESTVERQGLLRSLESLGDLVIATFIHHDPEAGRTGQISRGLDGSALLGDLRRRYPVIATECAASKAGSQLVTVAYFTGIEHPMASRKLCAVDWSAPSLVSEQTRD